MTAAAAMPDFAVAVHVRGGTGMSIDLPTVAEIAEYGASIDVDLYALGDDAKEES